MRTAAEDDLDRSMARLARGERDAFDPLFRALYPRALRLARARVGEELAADVAQATLSKLFSRAGEFEPGRAVLPWFFAIAMNEIRSVVRKRARETGSGGLSTEEIPSPDDPERLLLEHELSNALEGAVSALDTAGTEAIHVVLGRRPSPDISPAAFRKRVSRAYSKLRTLLGDIDDK